MNSTTTCNYFTPKDRLGDAPAASQTWNYASSTCVTASIVSATTTIKGFDTINGFSYGDVLIGFFLFVLVTGQFFGGILNRIVGVKVKDRKQIKNI